MITITNGRQYIEVEESSFVESAFWRIAGEGEKPSYAILRAAEYPPISDYVDGVVKGDQAQIDQYIATCLAVKAKYPKP